MPDTFLNTIKDRLTQDFQPQTVEVHDESHKHAGHAGFGTYSHLHIVISAAPFAGKSRVERERLVRASVMDQAGQDIHAMRFEFI